MVKVYFDGNLVDNPLEWESLNVAITFDHINQITEVKYDTEFTFVKGAFDYLYSRKDISCELISVLIETDCAGIWIPIVRGNIFVTDCIFDELHCEARTMIKDDGYSSRIQNNKQTVVSVFSETTKNGNPITAPTQTNLLLFNPTVGVYTEGIVRTYSVYEAFKFIISWMSDNTVMFESDFFSSGDGSVDHICSGRDLRNHDTPVNPVEPPSISFDDLFTVMRKIRNVAIGFQRNSNGQPILRIEPLSYFRNSSVILDLTDVDKTELSYVQELLFARIKVGSTIIKPNECDSGNTNCAAANNISYYGFETEEYSITGECNQDTELDLSIPNGYVVDTNTIEDVMIYGNDNFDRDIFLIQADAINPTIAKATNVLGIGTFWYNEDYTNKEVILRQLDYLTGVLTLFSLNNDINLFLYKGNTVSGVLLPQQTPTYLTYPNVAGTGIPLNNLVYDPFNRIDTGNERFTPVDEGVYQFCMGLAIDDFPTSDSGVIVSVHLVIEHYDSGGVILNRYLSDVRTHVTRLADPIYEEWTSPWIAMDSGDYCVFVADYAQNLNHGVLQARIVLGGSNPQDQYFQCCASKVAIQDQVVGTGNERRIAKTSTVYPIPLQDFIQYLNDTTKLIRLRNQRIDREGWNDEIKYDVNSGECNLAILSTER